MQLLHFLQIAELQLFCFDLLFFLLVFGRGRVRVGTLLHQLRRYSLIVLVDLEIDDVCFDFGTARQLLEHCVFQINLNLHLLSLVIVYRLCWLVRIFLIDPLPFALIELVVEDGYDCVDGDGATVEVHKFVGQS